MGTPDLSSLFLWVPLTVYRPCNCSNGARTDQGPSQCSPCMGGLVVINDNEVTDPTSTPPPTLIYSQNDSAWPPPPSWKVWFGGPWRIPVWFIHQDDSFLIQLIYYCNFHQSALPASFILLLPRLQHYVEDLADFFIIYWGMTWLHHKETNSLYRGIHTALKYREYKGKYAVTF